MNRCATVSDYVADIWFDSVQCRKLTDSVSNQKVLHSNLATFSSQTKIYIGMFG